MHHDTPPTSTPIKARPVSEFTCELQRLMEFLKEGKVQNFGAPLQLAIDAMQDLQEATDDLPDLTGSQWFLITSYNSARERTLKKLEAARKQVQLLGEVKSPLSGLVKLGPYAAEFVDFANSASRDLSLLQRPFQRTYELVLAPEWREEWQVELHEAELYENIGDEDFIGPL